MNTVPSATCFENVTCERKTVHVPWARRRECPTKSLPHVLHAANRQTFGQSGIFVSSSSSSIGEFPSTYSTLVVQTEIEFTKERTSSVLRLGRRRLSLFWQLTVNLSLAWKTSLLYLSCKLIVAITQLSNSLRFNGFTVSMDLSLNEFIVSMDIATVSTNNSVSINCTVILSCCGTLRFHSWTNPASDSIGCTYMRILYRHTANIPW